MFVAQVTTGEAAACRLLNLCVLRFGRSTREDNDPLIQHVMLHVSLQAAAATPLYMRMPYFVLIEEFAYFANYPVVQDGVKGRMMHTNVCSACMVERWHDRGPGKGGGGCRTARKATPPPPTAAAAAVPAVGG
jgi:hypothetical protein